MSFLTQFPKSWDYRHVPKLLGENYFLLLNKEVSQMRIPSNEYKKLFLPWRLSQLSLSLNFKFAMNKVLIRHYGSGFMVLAPSPTTSEKSMREQETSLIICVHPSCPILFCTISSLTLVHNPYSFSVLWRSTDFIIYFVCACVCTYACMCVFLAWCMCVCVKFLSGCVCYH